MNSSHTNEARYTYHDINVSSFLTSHSMTDGMMALLTPFLVNQCWQDSLMTREWKKNAMSNLST